MKCKMDEGPSCRRCTRAGVECIFRPRANVCELTPYTKGVLIVKAASRQSPPPMNGQSINSGEMGIRQSSEAFQTVLARLDTLEAFVGLNTWSVPAPQSTTVSTDEHADPALSGLWDSLALLKKTTHQSVRSEVWSTRTVKDLWVGYVTTSRKALP